MPPANAPSPVAPPELVIFLLEPMNVSATFVEEAVTHGSGIEVPERPRGEEMVVGQFPIFFIHLGDQLLQTKFMPVPYDAESCRPFVNGDPAALRRAGKSDIVKTAWRDHTGWIAVSDMTLSAAGFEFVGPIMAALVVVAQPLLIAWPGGNKLKFWDDEMLDDLRAGDLKSLFGR